MAAERWVVALENAHIPDAVLFGPFSTETSAAVYAASCRDRQPGDETTGQVTYRVVKLHPPINPDDLSADVGVFVQGD